MGASNMANLKIDSVSTLKVVFNGKEAVFMYNNPNKGK